MQSKLPVVFQTYFKNRLKPRGFALAVWPVLMLVACGSQSVDGPLNETGEDLASTAAALSSTEQALGIPAANGSAVLVTQMAGQADFPNEGFAPGASSADLVKTPLKLTLSQTVDGRLLRFDYTKETVLGPTQTSELIRDNLGAYTGSNIFGQPLSAMPSDHVAAARRLQQLTYPHSYLGAVRRKEATVTSARVVTVDGVPYFRLVIRDGKGQVSLFLSTQTWLPAFLRTTENDELLRDSALEVRYTDWSLRAGGLRLPRQVAIRISGYLTWTETRASVELDRTGNLSRFEFASTPVSFDPRLASIGAVSHHTYTCTPLAPFYDGRFGDVQAIELSPGVFHLTGSVHHSLAVEQSSGVVIFEAPLHEERSEGILNWARTQFPSKPVTHLVVTHFHTDHSGGVRAFAARGIKILVGAPTLKFFQDEVVKADSSLVPDVLSRTSGPAAEFVAVPSNGEITLADPVRPITVHHIGGPHASDMVVAFLARERLLFNSDLYSPNVPAQLDPPGARAFAIQIGVRGIPVLSHVGGHGSGTISHSDVLSSLGL